MAQDLVLAADGRLLQLPAHLVDAFGPEGNILDRVTINSLSFGGKVWETQVEGEKKKLMRTDEDGEISPVASIKVIILNYNQKRGRALYDQAKPYNPADPQPPICWSQDGVKPSDSVEAKQHPTCNGCPMAAKGSGRPGPNGPTIACGQHRMLTVIPANKLDFPAMRLKISVTSDWNGGDKDDIAAKKLAFDNYLQHIKGMGVPHTAMLVTKMSFDPKVDYPKIFFAPVALLEPHETALIKDRPKSDEVMNLLSESWTPAGPDAEPVVASAPVKPEVAAPLEPDEIIPPVKKEAPKPPPAEPAKKAKPPVDDDDGGFGEPAAPATKSAAPATTAAKSPAPPAAKAAEVPAAVANLLKDIDTW